MQGIWLPIITPFKNGEVDYEGYKNLLNHYLKTDITGIIPLGTTGEVPVIEPDEYFRIVEITLETVAGKKPVFVGAGGNYTKKVIETVKKLENLKVDGILSVCPYYNKPNQRGLYEHFKEISENTGLSILVYNIPHRTNVNMSNETLLRLAEMNNIIGVKDSCNIISQSIELIRNKPNNFYVFTGEDDFFYNNLVNGGDGGIMASAHLYTQKFTEVFKAIKSGNHLKALEIWNEIASIIPLLFKEPNPAPLKYCLKCLKQIESDELRKPLLSIEDDLRKELDKKLYII